MPMPSPLPPHRCSIVQCSPVTLSSEWQRRQESSSAGSGEGHGAFAGAHSASTRSVRSTSTGAEYGSLQRCRLLSHRDRGLANSCRNSSRNTWKRRSVGTAVINPPMRIRRVGPGSKWALMMALTLVSVPLVAACSGARTRPPGPAHSPTSSPTAVIPDACSKHPASLEAGSRVPPADLASIDFLSPSIGVGVTLSSVMCTLHKSAVGGVQLGSEPYPTRLAITRTGGGLWTVEGGPLPRSLLTNFVTSLAFSSATTGWVAADGHLASTSDGGRLWKLVNLGGSVAKVARSSSVVLALTQPVTSRGHWTLWSAPATGGSWRPGAAPPIPAVDGFSASALGPAPETAVVAVTQASPSGLQSSLVVTADSGATWSARTDPCQARLWIGGPLIAATSSNDLVSLCIGSAAAGSNTKGLYISQNAGRTWSPKALLTNLASPDLTGLPHTEATALAAPSSSDLWIATTNGLVGSGDGGQSWFNVANVNPQGATFPVFSFVGSLDGWLLAPGTGLWHTTNGRQWTTVGG